MKTKMLAVFTVVSVFSAVLLVVLSMVPVSWTFISPELDPLAHIAGGLSLTVMVGLGLSTTTNHRDNPLITTLRILAAAVFAFAVWAAIEALQSFVPNHGPEMADVRADLAGVLIGLAILFLLEPAIALVLRRQIES
ncbi:MAG: VanZ family protein [bacterium]|nr:VanZ family protein [bacterium]